MHKLLLILTLIFYSIGADAQTTRCVGGDTLCINLLPDTTICSATKLEFIAKATSSVTGAAANFTYTWTNLNTNTSISNKDSLNHLFTSTSSTTINVELHVQYINGTTFNVRDTFNVTINPLPAISLKRPYLTEACFTQSIYLNAFNTTPYGGTWHHWEDTTAISGAYFLPNKVGTKGNNAIYDLTYVSTNSYGCIDSAHTKIKILRLPPVKVNGAGPYCDNIGLQKLEPFVEQPASPNLGQQLWESLTQPNGVTEYNGEYHFDPYKALKGLTNPNILKYTFTDLTTGCYDSDTMNIIVNTGTTITFGNPGVHCASGPELKLDSLYNVSPAGGKWACINCNAFNPVIDSSYFTPSSLPNGFTYQLQYEVYTNGCLSRDAATIKTTAVPHLTVSADDYTLCENENSIDLHASPFGGKWSGKGVTDSTYYVNQGNKGDTNTLTYTYYDASLACHNYADVEIVVWKHPIINLSSTHNPLCDNDSNFITATYDNSITSFNWSYTGNGNTLTSGDSFIYYPHISDTLNGVTIYATGANPGCADSTTSVNFSVLNCSKVSVPMVEQIFVTIYPNPANDKVTLEKSAHLAFGVSLLSMDGKVLKTYNWEKHTPLLTINRNNLPAGIYYILLSDNQGNQYQEKLILN